MKILIVNSADINGGAAKAAYRLHRSLIKAGINSHMLVQYKTSTDYTVIAPSTKLHKLYMQIRPHIENLLLKIYPHKNKTRFSSSLLPFSKMVEYINKENPDIVHLHWICDGMLPIKDLKKIKAPIVWSLHDMWPFTGGCHYDNECNEYKNNCKSCKVLNLNKKSKLSQVIFNKKRKVYSEISNMTIIGLSNWITLCAKSSTLFKKKKIIRLPNLIDTSIFKPLEKRVMRDLWNLPLNKKLIVFGAVNATSDPRKGFFELSEALKNIKIDDVELVVFGSDKPKNSNLFNLPVHYVGQINDDISMVSLYNVADIVIVPSLQENLSNIILESLSCGTPVIAFNIGGNEDMIEHKKNGYLAKAYDTKDLAFAIEWIIKNDNNKLSNYARTKILKQFSSDIVIDKYIQVYKSLYKPTKKSKNEL